MGVVLGLMLCTGCAGGGSAVESPTFDESLVVKVSVLSSGTVLADGSDVSLAALDERLAEIHRGNGVVWYYRENASGQPPAVARQVIDLIIGRNLPISMSTKPDFSDVVIGGVSQPRR